MRPGDRDFDEEIRGHLALNVRERIDRGEEPEAARLAALRELGYVPAIRESMRRVWHSRFSVSARDARVRRAAGHRVDTGAPAGGCRDVTSEMRRRRG